MSQFKTELRRARTRQRIFNLLLVLTFLFVSISVAALLIASNGTVVKTLPKDAARTSTIAIEQGVGLVINESVYTFWGSPVLAIAADGFETAQKRITDEAKGGVVEILLREKSSRLVASTDPATENATWYLNGKVFKKGASIHHEINAGTYVVGVDEHYFKPLERQVVLRRGEETQVRFDLEKIKGSVEINSVPAGASVSIGEEKIGSTPVKVFKSGGKYRVILEKPGYEKVDETIEITNKKSDVARKYRLIRKMGQFRFSLSPKGGLLLVNGQKVDPYKEISVSAGVENSISYFKEGYYYEKLKVVLKPSERKVIELTLRPENGVLKVTSEPSASVYLDGKKVGETPLTLTIPAKPHVLELRKNRFATVRRPVRPKGNSQLNLDFKLQTELAARLATAKREYTNSQGLVLRLFEPTTFTMGAARHEKGQRANELLRKVDFRRPFYAGKHEVTIAQYAAYSKKSAPKDKGNFPATSIHWIDAALFCNWLSAKEMLTPFYSFNGRTLLGEDKSSDGYRLLTEAEWEWLARKAGRSAPTVFPWGNKEVVQPKTANIADESAKSIVKVFVPNYDDGYERTAPVGSFNVEPSGLFDIAGNVSEWVHDFYSLVPPQPGRIEIDPLGPGYGGAHVVRGANWRSGTRTRLRAVYREGQSSARDDIGFRVARYLY